MRQLIMALGFALLIATSGCNVVLGIQRGELTSCGDGTVDAEFGEECDDGNLDSTDLCTVDCKSTACGDGIIQPLAGETCDDGGTNDGDSCSPSCEEQRVLQIIGGGERTCALLSAGKVKCWGRNNWGQLGLGDTNNRGVEPSEMGQALLMVDLGMSSYATFIAANYYHACALLGGGFVKCWGYNIHGQLGLGDTNSRGDDINEMGNALLTIALGTSKAATTIATGILHTCALLNGGSVKCWGYNDFGQLGLGHPYSRGGSSSQMGDALPTIDLGTGKTATVIAAGSYHTCALLNNGSVKCWGYNGSGELGLGDTSSRGAGPNEMGDALPTIDLGTGKTATAIATGYSHTCALLNEGSVKCWGENSSGELGLGDIEHRGDNPNEMGEALPAVALGTGKTATAIAAGGHHTCALLNDGSVKCWGENSSGELGLGDTGWRGNAPNEMGEALPSISLGAGQAATAISAGSKHTCALLNNSTMKCWGQNSSGQLGLGDTNHRGDAPGEMGDNLPTVKLFSPLW